MGYLGSLVVNILIGLRLRWRWWSISSVRNFFNNFGENLTKGLNVSKLAKVVKFKPSTMSVDVIPLPTVENSPILNVPIATVKSQDFLIYYPLEKGDIVVLLFSDNDTDEILLGGDGYSSDRLHDISDCICIGGITLLSQSANAIDPSGLNIISPGGSIVMNKSGEVKIETPKLTYNGREVAVKGDPTSDGATIV